jgi:hypothetical protein
MPRGAAPGERRGGIAKGGTHKRTEIKELLLEILSGPDAQKVVGAIVKTEVRQPNSAAQRKAVEVLGEFMEAIRAVAARVQNQLAQLYLAEPAAAAVAERKDWTKQVAALEAKFEKWAGLTVLTSSKLAPFESPTFRAVIVSPGLPGSGDNAKVIDGNIIPLDSDAVGAARVYRRIVSAGSRRA